MRRIAARRRLFSSSAPKSYPRSLPSSLRQSQVSKQSTNHDSDPASASINLSPDVSRIFSNTAPGPESTPPSDPDSSPYTGALPPSDILEDIRTKIRISLHHHTQSKAISNDGTEPTLALYCPIEGGSYVIDETVKYLADTENTDLDILDGLQLAGGEHGKYGKAFKTFQLPPDELYESSFESIGAENDPQTSDAVDGSGGPVIKIIAPSFPFSQPSNRPPRREVRKSPARHSEAHAYAIFDSILNRDERSTGKRIVYIRNFQHISDSAPTWFPGLVKAVRERRIGEDEGAGLSPTVIILGVTPKVAQSEPSSSVDGSSNHNANPLAGGGFPFLSPANLFRPPPPRRQPTTSALPDAKADEYRDQPREQRLRDRLTSLEEDGDEAVMDELPEFEYTVVAPAERAVDQSSSSASAPTPDELSASAQSETGDREPPEILRETFGTANLRPIPGGWEIQRKLEELPPNLQELFKDKENTRTEFTEFIGDEDVRHMPRPISGALKEFLMRHAGLHELGDEKQDRTSRTVPMPSTDLPQKGKVQIPEQLGSQTSSSPSKSTARSTPFRRAPSSTMSTVSDPYARVAAVLPAKRSPILESLERCHLRREVNRLLLRMILAQMELKIPEGTGLLEKLHLRGINESIGWGVTAVESKPKTEKSKIPNKKISKDDALSLEKDKLALHLAAAQLLSRNRPTSKGEEEELRLTRHGLPQDMWKEFSERIFSPKVLTEMVERALSNAMSSSINAQLSSTSGEREASSSSKGKKQGAGLSTDISWATLAESHKAIRDHQVSMKSIIQDMLKPSTSTASTEKFSAAEIASTTLINQVKNDPTLDAHEQRLLGCIVDPSAMPTSFKEVHLPERTIDSVRTIVSLPILYPDVFTEGILKTHSMTGALLLGPPGVGKTLLARAVAKESGARMLMVKASDVEDMYVGEGEKLVKSVFSLARRLSPCVVFLDEVDALFASRESRGSGGAAAAHRGVITEFMQEMDGLKTNRKDGNVVVIGATNRPFDLDDAVLRRLPRRLLVDLPTEKDRLQILKILLRDEALAPDVDLASLAKQTETFSGSDLKHLCVSAALDSAKENLDLPWKVIKATPADLPKQPDVVETPSPIAVSSEQTPSTSKRLLSLRHFTKALTEITPSSSENLGTLTDLRKWNEEFGEGYKDKSKSRRRKWGDKFGFGGRDVEKKGESDGRVVPETLIPQP